MRAAGALILVVAAGVALATAGGASDLRAVRAPASGIEAPSGALLAAAEFDGPARLLWVRRGTLRPAMPPLRLDEEFVADFALSPDGRRMALGAEMRGRIQLVDLRRWRRLGAIELPGPRPPATGGASGLVWASPRRLLALSGTAYGAPATPVVVDPVRRRVVREADWRGRPVQPQAADGRLVFLSTPQGRSTPGRAWLVSFDRRGRLRELLLERIKAGTWRSKGSPWQHVEPALAVSPGGGRAYVVAGDARLVAEVDLRRWRVTYHEVAERVSALRRLLDLVEPPAHAKEPVDSQVRWAETLPNGAIAVTGEDTRATDPPHSAPPVPFGVWLIDPRTWALRVVDREAQDFTVAGGRLLARRWSMGGDGQRPIGVRAYDTAGGLRWTRFEGADTIVRGAAGRRAYVEVKRGGRRRIHVLELEGGRTLRTLPWRELRVLER
jgi:hypothetical protein